MWGDGRIPFSVQHNVGSVENLDGVIFFSVSITTSHILQVSCTVLSTVNENQPGRGGWKVIGHGEEIIDGNKGAGQPQWSREVDFLRQAVLLKKKVLKSDLKAAFVVTGAKDRLMLSLAV